MNEGKKVLLAGATGLIGSHLLKHLIASPGIARIIVISRRPLEGIASPKLDIRLVDFSTLSTTTAENLPNVDDAFCALGSTIRKAGSQASFREVDHDFILAFANHAKACGAQRFMLVSAIGADMDSSFFYSRVKGETERDVSSLGFQTLHIFRPGLLLGDRGQKRTLEHFGTSLSPFLNAFLVGRTRGYRAIGAESVARAMLAASFSGEAGRHTHTYDDILRLSSRL